MTAKFIILGLLVLLLWFISLLIATKGLLVWLRNMFLTKASIIGNTNTWQRHCQVNQVINKVSEQNEKLKISLLYAIHTIIIVMEKQLACTNT